MKKMCVHIERVRLQSVKTVSQTTQGPCRHWSQICAPLVVVLVTRQNYSTCFIIFSRQPWYSQEFPHCLFVCFSLVWECVLFKVEITCLSFPDTIFISSNAAEMKPFSLVLFACTEDSLNRIWKHTHWSRLASGDLFISVLWRPLACLEPLNVAPCSSIETCPTTNIVVHHSQARWTLHPF